MRCLGLRRRRSRCVIRHERLAKTCISQGKRTRPSLPFNILDGDGSSARQSSVQRDRHDSRRFALNTPSFFDRVMRRDGAKLRVSTGRGVSSSGHGSLAWQPRAPVRLASFAARRLSGVRQSRYYGVSLYRSKRLGYLRMECK